MYSTPCMFGVYVYIYILYIIYVYMYIYIIYIYYIYIILYMLLDHFAVFHLTYKENIKKTREAVTPRLDTVKQ